MMASVSGSLRRNVVPSPGLDWISMRPRSFCDLPAHHVHAHAAAGNVGDLCGGGEARLEDQVERLRCR